MPICSPVFGAFLVLNCVINFSAGALTSRSSECGDKYKCGSGQCIDSYLVCDGAVDCRDGTDETQAVCSKLGVQCPAFAFRCAYGACVNKDSKCNGRKDCADNSDELLLECVSNNSVLSNSDSSCKNSEFRCDNGQCIDEYSSCDGNRDCDDGSDETITQCVSVGCPAYTFKCAYGGCIAKVKKCNGVDDCSDGSDESEDLCGGQKVAPTPRPPQRPTTRRTTPWPYVPDSRPVTPSQPAQDACLLPERPEGGTYQVVGCAPGDRSSKCRSVPGTSVSGVSGTSVVLSYSCNKGFYLPEIGKNIFCINGSWEPKPPLCLRLCKALYSDSLELECLYRGDRVPCDRPSRPGTKVRPKCKQAYHAYQDNDPSSTFKETECSDDGVWELPLFKCYPDYRRRNRFCGVQNKCQCAHYCHFGVSIDYSVPTMDDVVCFMWDCGKPNPDASKPLISKGEDTKVGEYPWHAGLYEKGEDTFKQICGGTIISPNIILTAAHCIYVDSKHAVRDPKDLMVGVGKYKRSWDVREPYAQTSTVKQIVPQRAYRGKSNSYEQDIAVLDLTITISLSNFVLPACVDWQSEKVFQKGVLGTVVGWGQNEDKVPSENLQVAKVPYLDYDSCRKKSPPAFLRYLTYDKFCTGYTDGMGVQAGDSGGGLTFDLHGLHFVYGIVSVKPKDEDTIAAFTNVTEHIDWLQGVVRALNQQRFKAQRLL